MSPNATEEATKICAACSERLPITEFRRRYSGREERHAKCRRCFNAELRGRRAARRRGQFYHFETEVLRTRSDAVLARLVVGMTRRLGGEDAFVAQWWECLDRAHKEGKTHLSIRGFLACQKMWVAAERMKPPFNQLTAEERTEMVRAEAAKLIKEHPEVVRIVAEMEGWQFAPPPGVQLGDLADLDA